MGEKDFQESASIFSWVKKIRNLPSIFSWVGPRWAHPLGPHVGSPTWAQAWAQAPPAPAPDEFSDPNLTPLPTHPGIKYVARTLNESSSFLQVLHASRFIVGLRCAAYHGGPRELLVFL